MSYHGHRRLNESKLSHFSPKSLEHGNNNLMINRAGIKTPKNYKDLQKLDINRNIYSVSKENE